MAYAVDWQLGFASRSTFSLWTGVYDEKERLISFDLTQQLSFFRLSESLSCATVLLMSGPIGIVVSAAGSYASPALKLKIIMGSSVEVLLICLVCTFTSNLK